MPAARIFLFFFIAAIAGTLLHEFGHAFVAWLYGFHPQVHFAYCSTLSAADRLAIEQGSMQYYTYPHSTWITMGAPLQTFITGCVGMLLLWRASKLRAVDAYRVTDLLLIVLTYFHSRWIMNSAGILYDMYAVGKGSRADEIWLMNYWNIDVTAGTWVLLAYATFVLVKHHRLQLIVFGALGSVAGGWFWLVWAGPYIMP